MKKVLSFFLKSVPEIKRNLAYLAVAGFLLNGQCRKDEPVKYYIPLNPDFLSYCAFKQGSWWRYKEINTNNQTDSIYVSYYSTSEVESKKEGYNYIRLVMQTISLLDTNNYWARPFQMTQGHQWELQEDYNVGNGTYFAWRFYYADQNSLSLPSYVVITKLDSFALLVGGKYYDIYKIENSSSNYYNWIKTEYYARNIGVIRRELFDGKIWELLNYHINP